MASIDEVEHLFRHLVEALSRSSPAKLHTPIQISEIYKNILPYRHYRAALGFETNEDYEMALLQLLGGEGGFASVDPPEVQDALAEESRVVNPNPGAFRDFAAAKVFLNAGAVRTVTDANTQYAPPALVDPDGDDGFSPKEDVFSKQQIPMAKESPAREDIKEDEEEMGKPSLAVLSMAYDTDSEPETSELDSPVIVTPSCTACGEELPARRDVNFCPFCGHDRRPIFCSKCNADIEPAWRYCVECGQDSRNR